MNWCDNRLIVSGSAGDLGRFKQRVSVGDSKQTGGDGPLDFRGVVPLPEEWDGMSEAAARAWVIRHWGAPGQPARVRVTEGAGCLIYDFETRWVPPVAWVRRAAGAFPALAFELLYDEFFASLAGRLWIPAGGEADLFWRRNYLQSGFMKAGEWVERLPFGDHGEGWGRTPNWPCPDCGVAAGDYHAATCRREVCPVCEGRLRVCGCSGGEFYPFEGRPRAGFGETRLPPPVGGADAEDLFGLTG